MGKPIVSGWDVLPRGQISALVVVSTCFLAGGIIGCLTAGQVIGGGEDCVSAYLTAFITTAQSGEIFCLDMFALLWGLFRWPLFGVLLGFTALGLVGIPILFGVRGFALAFSIASFVGLYGGAGGILAFLLFGLSGVVTLPVLFVLGLDGFLNARALSARVEKQRGNLVCYSWCAVALGIGICIEAMVVPVLLSGVAQVIQI